MKDSGKIYLNKIESASLDFLYGDYELLTFYGRHAMERNVQRVPVVHGTQKIGSVRGTSSHQYNPMMILAEKKRRKTQVLVMECPLYTAEDLKQK